jgi:hypothetical protein
MPNSNIQIRLCWMATGGGIGAGAWHDDTQQARDAMRDEIVQGAGMTPPVSRWIDVKDVQPFWPQVAWRR